MLSRRIPVIKELISVYLLVINKVDFGLTDFIQGLTFRENLEKSDYCKSQGKSRFSLKVRESS